MGDVHESAGELLIGRDILWKSAPYKAKVRTASTESVTDSAAAGTAMSTGVLVDNGVISIFTPGDGTDIVTSLEKYQTLQGKRTGVVTSTHILHATPASFAAHTSSRNNYGQIFDDYLVSKPNLIFGGGYGDVNLVSAEGVGYVTGTTKTEMNSFLPTDEFGEYLDMDYGNSFFWKINSF